MATSDLSSFETLRLSAATAYYSVSRALKLDKLAALFARADLSLDTPIVLLGRCYRPPLTASSAPSDAAAANEAVLSDLARHFQSIIWLTYRSDFPPLPAGEVLLRSDAGWGCTLRSMQMLMAQTLQRHVLGSDWRWPVVATTTSADSSIDQEPDPPLDLASLLRLFWDSSDDSSPFSVHNLCRRGADCGVLAGRWLGPWVGCCALAAAAKFVRQRLNVHVAVLASTGGGAPVLHAQGELLRWLRREHASGESCDSAQSEKGRGDVSGSCAQHEHLKERIGNDVGVAAGAHGDGNADSLWRGLSTPKQPGLLLLVPLVLGIGKLNPVYVPQLREIFSFPQSVGIVGGRPSSSLYFVGCQENSLLYLDPHTIFPAASSDADWKTFQSDVLKTFPLPHIDPSLALGFYCRNAEEFEELCDHLRALEHRYSVAPLVCVRSGEEPTAEWYEAAADASWADDDTEDEEGEVEGDDATEGVGMDVRSRKTQEEEGENETSDANHAAEKTPAADVQATHLVDPFVASVAGEMPLETDERGEEDDGGDARSGARFPTVPLSSPQRNEAMERPENDDDIDDDIAKALSPSTNARASEMKESGESEEEIRGDGEAGVEANDPSSHANDEGHACARAAEESNIAGLVRARSEGDMVILRQASSVRSHWELV